MHPVLFEIPGLGFPLRSFGVLVAAGFLFAVWLWGKALARYGHDPAEDPNRGSQVGVWILIGVLGGARLFYVGVEVAGYLAADPSEAVQAYLEADERGPHAARLAMEAPEELERAQNLSIGYDLLHDPLQIFAIWRGGLVMYGGFLGAVLLGMWSARKQGLDPWNALDTGLVCGFFGQAIGRWGCLLVGDDYGSVVGEAYRDLPFPLTVTVPSREWLSQNPESLFPAELSGEVLWATQPWMSINAFLVGLVGWMVLRRRRWVGQVSAVIVIHYAISRFVIEGFRGDAVRGVWFGGALSTSQLLSIPGLLLGLFLLFRRVGSGDPPERARSSAA